jgi:peptidoglycan/LPS O-acetylase OafA/YrhL
MTATRTVAAPSPRRIDEFDVLRGAAILMVIYLHAYFTPWAGVPQWELVVLHVSQLFANSAVPTFVFMSAFLLARDRSPDFASFTRHRVHRLMVPLLFWMTAALVFVAWRQGALTFDMLRSFALFDIEGQFYFVFVLLVLTFAAYPLRHVGGPRLRRIVVAAFAVNLATVAYYSVQPLSGLAMTIAYRNPLMWVFAFTSGLWLGRTRGDVSFGGRVTALATGGMAVVAAVYLVQGERGGYPNSYFGVTVFLFAGLGFLVYPAAVRSIQRWRVGHVLLAPVRALSPYAFAIYLVHKPYFVGYLSDRLVSHGPFARDYLSLVLALSVVGGVASIAAVVGAARLAPGLAWTLLGIEPRRPMRTGDTGAG